MSYILPNPVSPSAMYLKVTNVSTGVSQSFQTSLLSNLSTTEVPT